MTHVSRSKQGNLRFGFDNPDRKVPGEVKTYKLSDDELTKIIKDTEHNKLPTKDDYLDLKAQGKTDRDIRHEWVITPDTLKAFKRKWGLINYEKNIW